MVIYIFGQTSDTQSVRFLGKPAVFAFMHRVNLGGDDILSVYVLNFNTVASVIDCCKVGKRYVDRNRLSIVCSKTELNAFLANIRACRVRYRHNLDPGKERVLREICDVDIG